MSITKDNKPNNGYSRISIGLASPEEILAQSSGEVLKPETINYRTLQRRAFRRVPAEVSRNLYQGGLSERRHCA